MFEKLNLTKGTPISILDDIAKKHKEVMQKRDVMLIDKNTASASKKEYEEAVENFNQVLIIAVHFLLDVEAERKQPKLPGIKNGIADPDECEEA